jgi:hypothetical protein
MQRVPDVPWTGEVIDGYLFSHGGARAYEHVRRGCSPEELGALLGAPPEKHQQWARFHHQYAALVAAGPRVQAPSLQP